MVDAITGFIVGKIGGYLIEEASMIMGIKDDLEELKTELTCIQGYLKDVEAREREDMASKEWTKLVLDLAYDIEDVLDTYFLKFQKRSQRRGMRRMFNKIGKTKDSYHIVDDIKNLKRRISDLTRKRVTYGIGNLNETQGENAKSWRMRNFRRARPFDQEEIVVGLEDDSKIILAKLLDDNERKRYVISIFGMGGLGKTALARKLYNSEDVKRRFDCRAWTYVSQEYKTRDILMRIIKSLGVASAQDLEKIKELTEDEELEVYLYGLLDGKKYLVVVDDLWEPDAWQSLKRALPYNHGGSKVIVTTRIRAVAQGIDERVYAHNLRFLSFEESWKLFEQKAFKNMQMVDVDSQKLGKEIVSKCGGLPLAIVVLAGLLSGKKANEWKNVCGILWRRLKDDSIYVSSVFDLSFKEMRQELKLCFLYLSVFPEDYEINVEKLIQLLVAEGFIQEEEVMMEDMARYFLEELIDRSVVKAERIERGKVITCRIHDLIRDMVIKNAKELNFLNVYNEQHSSTSCRREVVHHFMNKNYFSNRGVNKRMRSFLFFGEQNRMQVNDVETNNTLKLKLLRVLNLGGLRFVRNGNIHLCFSDVIGELIHLRYLGIDDTGLENLPASVSNLHFLQTLDAFGYSIKYFKQTTDLSNLTSLRHVMGRFLGDLLIGDAVNLQTLRTISSYSWSQLKHELFINLRDLEIYDSFDTERRVHLDLSSFSKLTNIRVLKLNTPTFTLFLEKAVQFPTLVDLTLKWCYISRLPKDMDLIFPSLESLTLVGTNFLEDPMPVLQKLQRLEDLVLKGCECPGVKMIISAQGFERLRKLELRVILYELQIDDEAMPSLIRLKLRTRGRVTQLIIPDRLKAFIRGYVT